VQAYMFVTGIHICKLVQHFDGATRTDEYEFDEERWEDIAAAAAVFAENLEQLIESEDKQDELLRSRSEPNNSRIIFKFCT
jgi:hypothetical protein